VQHVRGTWSSHVRLGLAHELPLIEAMRQTVASSGAQPRRRLVDIIAELQAAPDDESRKRLALDLTDDASVLKPDELLRLKDTLKQTFGLSAGWVKEWTAAVRAAAKARREHAASLIPAPTPADVPTIRKKAGRI
jgi:hypothetical protein